MLLRETGKGGDTQDSTGKEVKQKCDLSHKPQEPDPKGTLECSLGFLA